MPWRAWLREHGGLEPEDELPEGVPLVSHPLWLLLAEVLQFRVLIREKSHGRKHINLLELEAVFRLEEKLALGGVSLRYLLGADSQVALAALLKGRSSSPRINAALRRSLPVVLGSGIYGCYGFVPSLANPSDDPTRGQPVRAPSRSTPNWLYKAFQGCFDEMDRWLSSCGFDPFSVAGLPFADETSFSWKDFSGKVLKPLDKPEKLKAFREKDQVSHQVDQKKLNVKERTREQKEPLGQTKSKNKRQKKQRVMPTNNSVASQQVAPPARKVGKVKTPSPGGLPKAGKRVRRSHGRQENELAPLLSEDALKLLQQLPPRQFIRPGGGRSDEPIDFSRRGFLDLFSGASGVAKRLASVYKVWVLTYDYEHGAEQNLLDEEVRQQIYGLLHADAFLGCGMAPEYASFSRAVTPAVRSADKPLGLENISENMKVKVAIGNSHASFVCKVFDLLSQRGLIFLLENPDGSFLWLHPEFQKRGLGRAENSYRFDMCTFSTPWRKRIRIATNCELSGLRELCCGGHSHLKLRGRSSAHRCSWARVAQVYPLGLCRKLSAAMANSSGLSRRPLTGEPLSVSMAKCSGSRMGEASHPGPAQVVRGPRDPEELRQTPLHDHGTLVIQERVWRAFTAWLASKLSQSTLEQLFLCPSLAVWALQQYGLHLYSCGGKLYELRHLLVLVQRKYPRLRAEISPAWELISRWEELHPVRHREPLPEVLFKAMFVLAYLWKWKRVAATLLLGVEGIARIGELLAARRADLFLPSDAFDSSNLVAFLKVKKPKTLRRGLGRVQHLKIKDTASVLFLEKIFGALDPSLNLCPLSASAFRRRWNKLLDALQIPVKLRPTPGGIRGRGAVIAYRRGEPISDIMWRMRITAQRTLESYLQETAAESLLAKLPSSAKERIQSFSSLYSQLLGHCP